MAKGRKSGGRDFLPGNKANPKGRPRTPDDIREVRRKNKFDVERLLDQMVRMTKDEVIQLIKEPETPALTVMLGSVIVKAVGNGDQHRLEFILNRLIGKIHEAPEDEKLLDDHSSNLRTDEQWIRIISAREGK